MSIFDKVIGTFVDIEKDQPLPQAPQSTPVASNPFMDGLASKQQVQQPTFTQQNYVNVSKENADKYTQHFNSLMETANLPGPDYFEFMKMSDSLSVIPKDSDRVKAVFSALAVQGVTKELLLSSAQHYVEMIKTDSNNFKNVLDTKMSGDIQNRKTQITTNTEQIETNTKLIAELTAQNEQLRTANVTLAQEIKTAEDNIVQFENAYRSVCSMTLSRIESDVNLITQYL